MSDVRVIIPDFIDIEDDRYKYKYLEEYPRDGYKPSQERFKALATTNNKSNKVIIAQVYNESDFEEHDVVDEAIDYTMKDKKELQKMLDKENIEYKARDNKDKLIKLLEGE